jgi:hypothetical protein
MVGAIAGGKGFDDSLLVGDDEEVVPVEQQWSKGSTLHQWGTCKPCAFYLKDNCENGASCIFCHLCEPGEKKRRKKERLAIARESRWCDRKQGVRASKDANGRSGIKRSKSKLGAE